MQRRRVHLYELHVEQAGVTESASRVWLNVKSETYGYCLEIPVSANLLDFAWNLTNRVIRTTLISEMYVPRGIFTLIINQDK